MTTSTDAAAIWAVLAGEACTILGKPIEFEWAWPEGMPTGFDFVSFREYAARMAAELRGPFVRAGVKNTTVAEYEWHYLSRGRSTHARKRRADGLDQAAICGTSPVWHDPRGWYGTGTQEEYERAEALPRCARCLNVLAGPASTNRGWVGQAND